jgi:hypothetical protein
MQISVPTPSRERLARLFAPRRQFPVEAHNLCSFADPGPRYGLDRSLRPRSKGQHVGENK